MRKLLFLPLLLLIAACGSTAAPEVTPAPEDRDSVEAVVEDNTSSDAVSQDGKGSVATGATPQEAGIVREQDYSKGTDDPTVTIIEYGDFQ